MANQLRFDELNEFSEERLIELIEESNEEFNRKPSGARRSLPYRRFFGEMYLKPEEKEKRIRMAEDLDFVFLLLIAWIAINNGMGDIQYSYLYRTIEEKYWRTVRPYVETSSREAENGMKSYIARQTRDVVDNTMEHLDDGYFLSEDRAEGISENQVNGIANCDEFYWAYEAGYTDKTWITMQDNRVRETHQEVDGLTIPLDEPFRVGDSELMFPGDDSLGADASELANCRCTLEYR